MKSVRLVFSSLVIIFTVLSLLGVAYATSSTEALSRMQSLQEQGKVPAYVLEQGTYKYTEGVRTAHVQGKNVFMRSQPLKNARIVAKLTHVDLEYFGEWKHPKSGERWICVRRNGEIGWIYGQYIQLISSQKIGSQVNEKTAMRKTNTMNSSKSDNSCCGGDTMLQLVMILVGVAIYFSGNGNGTNGTETKSFESFNTNTNEKYNCCPEYQRDTCYGCYHLNRNHRNNNVSHAKCEYLERYVDTSESPQYNVEHYAALYEEECCPYYNKYSCGVCPWMDSSDPSDYFDGYYKCKHFNAYVHPDESPQYNSENLKYG